MPRESADTLNISTSEAIVGISDSTNATAEPMTDAYVGDSSSSRRHLLRLLTASVAGTLAGCAGMGDGTQTATEPRRTSAATTADRGSETTSPPSTTDTSEGSLEPPGSDEARGLSVRSDGSVVRNEPPYDDDNGPVFRGIGVNYFSLFSRRIRNPGDESFRAGLQELGKHDVPFARFMASGFWPVDWQFYREDRERYFDLLDGVVGAAEEAGVGLVPSLFWYAPTVPDVVGEPVSRLGDPDSQTISFVRTYTRELVTRYRDSPAIWGWEFGNEYNLNIDFPNPENHRFGTRTDLGQPARRGPEDDLSTADVVTAFTEFAREVRRNDPHRLVTTGNSAPRPTQWHQWNERTWERDTRSQFTEVLAAHHPDPVDTVSLHNYPARTNGSTTAFQQPRFGTSVSTEEFYRATVEAASEQNRPVFLGETGLSRSASDADGESTRETFDRVLSAVVESGIPLAAVWVYDAKVNRGLVEKWNVTFENDRAYQLRALREANDRLWSGDEPT